jgi:hypothetical protein
MVGDLTLHDILGGPDEEVAVPVKVAVPAEAA